MLELTNIRETKVYQEAMEEGMEKGIEEGMAKGIEKGMEKGMEQALEHVAIRSLAKGTSVADVAELTGLSVAHVKRLKKKSNSKN